MTELVHERAGWREGQRVAVVTGASGAIGSGIAERLAKAGHALVLVDRAADGARTALEKTGAPGLVIAADLAEAGSAADIMALAGGRIGRVDFLVNNAGLNRSQSVEATLAEDWDAVMAVNLRAPLMLAQKAIPFWKAQGGGAIVTIGSRTWLSGANPAYTASKAGVVGLTRALAVELGPLNVRANTVAPSYIDTPFTRMNRSAEAIAAMHAGALRITPLPRLGTVEDVAGAVAFLLSDEAGFITGEVLHVCGGSQLAAQSYSFGPRS